MAEELAPGAVDKKGQVEGVEAGAFEDQVDAKASFIEKVNLGTFTFNEAEIRALSKELGVEDDVQSSPAFVSNEGGPDNPMAGLTPATGSGGTPYEKDAATEETVKYAKSSEAKKAAEGDDVAAATARRLRSSVDAK